MAKEPLDVSKQKKKILNQNTIVRAPIARVEKQDKKNPGRPRKITPRKMLNGINSYFEWCEQNDRVPSIKGMMLHMKMMRDQFYSYIEYPEFRDILEQARMVIAEWCENDVYRTPGQCAGKIAYMKNVHSWADKIDTTNVNENRNTTVLSVEDAKAKIASLAHLINPELLEAVTSRYTLNQIAHKTVDAEIVSEKESKDA